MRLIFLISILILPVSSYSQDSPFYAPDVVQLKVVNEQASFITKPEYPAAARAVGATGVVSVQVLVDEKGYVEFVQAVAGHPLLRKICEDSARLSQFHTYFKDDKPVRFSGILIFRFFESPKFSFEKAGFLITLKGNSALSKPRVKTLTFEALRRNCNATYDYSKIDVAVDGSTKEPEPLGIGISQQTIEGCSQRHPQKALDYKIGVLLAKVRQSTEDREKLAAAIERIRSVLKEDFTENQDLRERINSLLDVYENLGKTESDGSLKVTHDDFVQTLSDVIRLL